MAVWGSCTSSMRPPKVWSVYSRVPTKKSSARYALPPVAPWLPVGPAMRAVTIATRRWSSTGRAGWSAPTPPATPIASATPGWCPAGSWLRPARACPTGRRQAGSRPGPPSPPSQPEQPERPEQPEPGAGQAATHLARRVEDQSRRARLILHSFGRRPPTTRQPLPVGPDAPQELVDEAGGEIGSQGCSADEKAVVDDRDHGVDRRLQVEVGA